jgi:hypothetical protein
VYRALVAATLDRERALDGLHDAFEEGICAIRRPTTATLKVGSRVALRKTRRGIFFGGREVELTELSADDPTAALLRRLDRCESRSCARANSQ